MKRNLIAHIREHYGNKDFKGKEHLMDTEIDYEAKIEIGAAHYHVFGVVNSYAFLQYAQEHLNSPIKIIELQYKMGEIRYLLQKVST